MVFPRPIFIFPLWNILGFFRSSVSKESVCSEGDLASIPGSGRSPGEGNGNMYLDSCLESSMDVEEPGGLQSIGLQSLTRLSD